jgi:two-component system phosphate regulon sensor histidine kinase PhoR
MAAAIGWLGSAVEARDPAIILFLRDLTEQERLDEMRADFIANASHELKTPLASLLGFIETLQGAARNDADARDRFLGIMAKQAERMARLIDNLMSLSKVEMRAHLKPQDQVNIADVVRSSVDAMEPMARDAKIELSVSSAADDAFVLGDRDELTQVFLNLIHNGIKYGRAGGRVDISIARVSEAGATARIHITVADDGPGISPQHLPRLTERFYRVPEIGPDRAGTGLGLAIAKHVLNRHRGELRIVSTEGAGSKFTVVLAEAPKSPAHPDGPAAEARPALAVWP